MKQPHFVQYTWQGKIYAATLVHKNPNGSASVRIHPAPYDRDRFKRLYLTNVPPADRARSHSWREIPQSSK